MHLAELREYAGRRGWQIVEEFTDQGVSGFNEPRPALRRCAIRSRLECAIQTRRLPLIIPKSVSGPQGDFTITNGMVGRRYPAKQLDIKMK
jgi:hypothetical protein